jgi:predicted lipoprotein
VQLFKDASFYLCVNAVNTANNRGIYESYNIDVMRLVSSILPYLEKEVVSFHEVQKARAENYPEINKIIVMCNSGTMLSEKEIEREEYSVIKLDCNSDSVK